MFSKALKKTSFANFVSKHFYSSNRAGNLYTWGSIPAGLGSRVSAVTDDIMTPRLIEEFHGNVTKVSMGPQHSAAITEDGSLYTFGYDRYGNLGLNITGGLVMKPTLVSFFKTNNQRVIDVACGKDHTVALTEGGDVYTWGHGGRRGFLRELLQPAIGPLGHGVNTHRSVPTAVEALRGLPPIQSITTGNQFCLALNADSDLYNWGRGKHGVFGNGSQADLKVPALNDTIKELREHNGIRITKLKACDNYTLALFDDGSLWGWGNNNQGQIGCGHRIGVEQLDIDYDHPVKVDYFQGRRVVDFDAGEDMAIVLTEDNQVYYMGLRLIWQPEKFPLPENKRVKKVTASYGTVAVITEDNYIYSKNPFVGNAEEDYKTGLFVADNSIFKGGDIIDIGGSYRNRFAIVKN